MQLATTMTGKEKEAAVSIGMIAMCTSLALKKVQYLTIVTGSEDYVGPSLQRKQQNIPIGP